jgi:hypothetical protein
MVTFQGSVVSVFSSAWMAGSIDGVSGALSTIASVVPLLERSKRELSPFAFQQGPQMWFWYQRAGINLEYGRRTRV